MSVWWVSVVLAEEFIVTTDGGFQRSATLRELRAYEAYNQGVASWGPAAISLFERAVAIKPDLPEAWMNLGNLRGDLRDYETALDCADNPKLKAQALSNIGFTLHKRGLDWLARAESYLLEAVAVAPDFVDARFNLGSVLFDLGKLDDAELQYHETLRLDPNHENALLNLANIYFARGDSVQAARAQTALIETASNETRSKALNNLGQTYRDVNDHQNARASFRRAYEATRDPLSLANLVTARRTLCDWQHDASLMEFKEALMPYDALMLASASPRDVRDLTTAHVRDKKLNVSTPTKRRRSLRIGYLSYDFREHPMGYLTRRLVTSHENCVVLSYGEDDGSELRRRAETLPSGGFVELANLSLSAVADHLTSVDLDVVVDLMAHTRGARLEVAALAKQSAGLLINYLGYPGTAGGPPYDYTIADAVVAPLESDEFAEPRLLLPHAYQANDYALFSALPPDSKKTTYLRLCNFNHVDKFDSVSWTLWMNVLRRLPGASLTLLEPKAPLDSTLVATLSAEAAARGVRPDRIDWVRRVSKEDHLQRLADHCDVFVDNLAYGAHTTASDALWAGVPVVTVRGYGKDDLGVGRFSSRVGASLLATARVTDTIVDSLRDFEDVVASFETDDLEDLRRRLLAASLATPLFDANQQARDLERAYEAAAELAAYPQHQIVAILPTLHHAGSRRACVTRSLLATSFGTDETRCSDTHEGNISASSSEAQRLGLSLRLATAFPEDPDARHLRGLALHMAGRHRDAVAELRASLRIAPTATHFWANLGQALRASGDRDGAAAAFLVAGDLPNVKHAIGTTSFASLFAAAVLIPEDPSIKLQLGAALDDAGHGDAALDVWFAAVRQRHAQRHPREQRQRDDDDLVRVTIWCDEYGQTWWPSWGPSFISSGLGGSEEAVVFLGRELANRGYRVDVYLEDPPPGDVGRDVVSETLFWWPLASYDPNATDIFIAWRYHISAALAPPHAARFVWLQDVPPYSTWTREFVEGLSGIFTLSAFHSRTLPRAARHKARITPNGIDPTALTDGPNSWDTFAYGSAPNRGLYDLLRVWPRIKASLSTARLVVYYGFSSSFESWAKDRIEEYVTWKSNIMHLLQQDGVEYRGMVDHAALARGYANSGFLLYPTTYPETGCVTVMKAMAMGAIPITSRYQDSVVPELTGDFDLGPIVSRNASSEVSITVDHPDYDHDWMAEFADAVIKAGIAARDGGLDNHRRTMKADARRRFLWRHVAATWDGHFGATRS